MSSDLEADKSEATLEIVAAVNDKLDRTMQSYQDLLERTSKERDEIAMLKVQVQHLGYGMMTLMQKHHYTQCRVTLGQMRQNQNSGNVLNVSEDGDTECVKFEITQLPFSYEEHLNDIRATANQPDPSGCGGDSPA